MNENDRGLTIGKLAKAAQVGVETVRYYQRLNLLPTPAPRGSAFRYYSVELIDRIRFIKRAQGLGFSLEQVALLLQLNDGTERHQIRQLAKAHLESIREKIADLNRMESMLAGLVHACEHTERANSCPIIAAFSDGKEFSSELDLQN